MSDTMYSHLLVNLPCFQAFHQYGGMINSLLVEKTKVLECGQQRASVRLWIYISSTKH